MEENKNGLGGDNFAPVAKAKKDYFLPIAIVIAGIVIAIAVIYSNGLKNKPVEPNGQTATIKEISLSAQDRILGQKEAKITIFEFSDYECPYCAKYHSEARPQVIANFVNTGKAKLVFRDMVFHDKSPFLSNAVWCAADQNKYWEMHDAVFDQEVKSVSPDKAGLITLAKGLGLDETKFTGCVDGENHKAELLEITRLAQEAGFRATPISLVVKGDSIKIDANYLVTEMQKNNYIVSFEGGVAIVGAQPFSVFQTEIDKLLK